MTLSGAVCRRTHGRVDGRPRFQAANPIGVLVVLSDEFVHVERGACPGFRRPWPGDRFGADRAATRRTQRGEKHNHQSWRGPHAADPRRGFCVRQARVRRYGYIRSDSETETLNGNETRDELTKGVAI